jgi:1,2-phenylacetyl-CoA epoxidase catalytic subunit
MAVGIAILISLQHAPDLEKCAQVCTKAAALVQHAWTLSSIGETLDRRDISQTALITTSRT